MYQQSEYKKDMEKAVLAFREDLSKIRAGRANPRILDDITFEYFGTPTPIAPKRAPIRGVCSCL